MKTYTKYFGYGIIVLATLCLTSCNSTMTKVEMFPNFYKEKPLSILILPPINESTAAEADEYYLTTIAEPLSYSGFYVYPNEVIMDALHTEGIDDGGKVASIPPSKFKDYFGADAILLVKIVKWNKSYYIVGADLTVTLEFVLKSTKTGETLWEYTGTIKKDLSGGNGGNNGLAGLLIKAAVTAVNAATADYTPVARDVNVQVLSTIPYGKYNSLYDTDRETPVTIQPGSAADKAKKQ
jgi:hypothetical protein